MTKKDKESPLDSFPESDRLWTEEQWKFLIEYLVSLGLVSYKEVASLVLGNLNPSQVGTSIASKKTFHVLCSRRPWVRQHSCQYLYIGRRRAPPRAYGVLFSGHAQRRLRESSDRIGLARVLRLARRSASK